jgi:hypothetical protein
MALRRYWGSAVWRTRRYWGYAVWGTAAAVIVVPELWAFADPDVGWTTISAMTGHLEYRWDWVELIVIATIVLPVFGIIRFPPWKEAHGARAARRLTRDGRPTPTCDPESERVDHEAHWRFAVAATIGSFLVIAGASIGVLESGWNDAPRHYHVSYIMYGLIGLFWVLTPMLVAFFFKQEAPFPPLIATVANLERAVGSWRPEWLGASAALATPYVILAGLAILVVHLTLYPFPSNNHTFNPCHGPAAQWEIAQGLTVPNAPNGWNVWVATCNPSGAPTP